MLALSGLVGGLVVNNPVWIYQIWAYLAPALLAKEKKYALAFLSAAVPLFLAGVAVGYLIMPGDRGDAGVHAGRGEQPHLRR